MLETKRDATASGIVVIYRYLSTREVRVIECEWELVFWSEIVNGGLWVMLAGGWGGVPPRPSVR